MKWIAVDYCCDEYETDSHPLSLRLWNLGCPTRDSLYNLHLRRVAIVWDPNDKHKVLDSIEILEPLRLNANLVGSPSVDQDIFEDLKAAEWLRHEE